MELKMIFDELTAQLDKGEITADSIPSLIEKLKASLEEVRDRPYPERVDAALKLLE